MSLAGKSSARTAGRIGASALGFLVVFILFEGFFRLAGFVMESARRSKDDDKEFRYTVLCEGDSFTYGLGGLEFPSQMEEILNRRAGKKLFRVVNKGLPGMNTAIIAKQLNRHIRQYAPDVVIVLAGEDNAWNTLGLSSGRELSAGRKIEGLLLHLRTYKFVKMMLIGMKRDGFSRDRPGGAQETDDFPSNGYELYLRAQKLEEGRHYAQARALYEKFTALNPNHPAGYARTASCLEKEGLEKRAINTWIQGTRVKTAPESEMIYFELGYAFLRAKKTEEAQRWWKEGLSKFPASPKLYQALARMYNDQGRIKEALVYAEQHPELRENPAVGALARAAQRAGEKKTGLRQFMSFPEGPPGEGSIELRISKGLREDVLRIYEVGRRTGVPLVFASYPDHAYPEVIAAAQESSGRFVDFRSIFKEKFKSREDYISDDDCHCNTAGYRVMAERLADEVERLLRP